MIIGVDVDGVLADFNRGLREMLIRTTGRKLIPEGEEPSCWNYATEQYGYTKEEDRATWRAIIEDRAFWGHLDCCSDAPWILAALGTARQAGAEVYFITARPGATAKVQTETWLERVMGFPAPTVLIARGDKGFIAHGLGLTHFIDDRPDNNFSVRVTRKPGECRIFMPLRAYNTWAVPQCAERGIEILPTCHPFVDAITSGVAYA